MIFTNFIAPVAVFLFLASSAYGTTAADVIGANSALTNQTDTIDIAVVAITDQTPATTAQVCIHILSWLSYGSCNKEVNFNARAPASPSVPSISHQFHFCRAFIPHPHDANLGPSYRIECGPFMGTFRKHRRGADGWLCPAEPILDQQIWLEVGYLRPAVDV